MIAQGRWHIPSYALSLKDSALSVANNGDHIAVCHRAEQPYSVSRAGPHQRRSLLHGLAATILTGSVPDRVNHRNLVDLPGKTRFLTL
jgi:hypothetical protein